MFHKIKEGAIFVADAHVNEKRDDFYEFLKSIEDETIKTPQLFLMGDMFDLLIGGVKYTNKINKKYIDIINSISKSIEVFYFEGNHDFNLKILFPNIKVFSYSEQPAIFESADKKILLLHGDKFVGLSYTIYTYLIRSAFILFVVSLFDNLIGGIISKKIINAQYGKNICKKLENFDKMIKRRINNINIDNIYLVMEGHYHQNMMIDIKKDKKYINIPSFACNKSFIIVKSHLEFRVEQFTLFKRR